MQSVRHKYACMLPAAQLRYLLYNMTSGFNTSTRAGLPTVSHFTSANQEGSVHPAATLNFV